MHSRCIVFIAAGLFTVSTFAEETFPTPDQAMISLYRPAGWSVGTGLEIARRELERTSDAESIKLDLQSVTAGIGATVLPFLQVRAEAGAVQAEALEEDGDGGPVWGLSATAYPLEFVIDRSPELGRTRVLGIDVTVAYRSHESNFEDEDFEWSELQITPMLRYSSNLQGNALRQSYEPDGISAGIGLAFSSIDADLGPDELEEKESFGLALSADFHWRSGWATRLEGILYGGSDRHVGLSLLRRF